MRIAIRDARLTPDDIDHVNAHGTSTLLEIKAKPAAIKTVFWGTCKKKLPLIPQNP